jgi:hypothetical protein
VRAENGVQVGIHGYGTGSGRIVSDHPPSIRIS